MGANRQRNAYGAVHKRQKETIRTKPEAGSSWQQQIRTSLITGGDCMDFVPEESIKNMQKRIDL